MEHEYNVRKRIFKNGLVELRLYKKAVRINHVRDAPNKKFYEEYNPFENDVLKYSMYKDADGFDCEKPTLSTDVVINKSIKRTIDKIYDYANSNVWDWFCTFTFSPDKLDRADFDDVSTHFSKWLNNARTRYCRDMKYLVVPEKHKDGTYHFHALMSDCWELNFKKAINQQEFYNGKKNKYFGEPLVRNGEQVYDIDTFNLGFTDCSRVRDTKKVSNYILKYVTKDLIKDTPGRKRYWASKNLDVPEEKIYCVPVGDYGDFIDKVTGDLRMHTREFYLNECDLCYGDFENKITYLKFSDCDVEFDGEIFASENIGPVRTRQKSIDDFFE